MKKTLQRFIEIWKPDFLAKFFAYESHDNKTTALFWITSNFLMALIFFIFFCFALLGGKGDIIKSIEDNIVDDVRVTNTDGQLTIDNIEEPFLKEISAEAQSGDYGEDLIFIIDTKSDTYDLTSLDEYGEGILIKGDRALFKDGEEITQIIFADTPDFSVAREDVIDFVDSYFMLVAFVFASLIGVVMFVYFAGFRLVSAFWWALMLFILTKIFDIKCGYMTAYKSVLNFYFIPLIVVFGLGVFNIGVPFLTTAIFGTVFVVNLIWIKNHTNTKEEDVTVSQKVKEAKKLEEAPEIMTIDDEK
ncbi:MAG: DUF1189 family protein [Patescibacteria group bacterium]